MATHDPGEYAQPIRAWMVFVIEPQFRVPEERRSIRLKYIIAVTSNGVEILSDFVPRDIESIERLMTGRGLLRNVERIP